MTLIDKREVNTHAGTITVFTLKNKNCATVELSTIGAGITRIVIPDKNGKMTDVVLGYDNVADYLYDSPCAGKTPGRFANRISNARFALDGNICRLAENDGKNSLHGGPKGFHNRIWDYEIIDNGVRFSRISPDGEEGYPGNLHVSVTYRWDNSNTLNIIYEAETDAPTVINLTNHAYFNLGNIGKSNILSHILTINSSTRVQSDSHDIPTGKILTVKDTPLDFRQPKTIGRDISEDFENLLAGKGYNHYFLLDNRAKTGTSRAATLYCPDSGIRLDVETDLPGLMLYTGNWLNDSPVGRNAQIYHDYDGVAIECQFPPDAPNQPSFPSTILRPGQKYRHTISYIFS